MPIADFTFTAYAELMDLIHENGYSFTDYHDTGNDEKKCILRHDVDSRIEKSLLLGEIEFKKGISSTYFILLRTDMYNVFSKRCVDILNQLQEWGHEIGLHYDEKFLSDDEIDIEEEIKKEAGILAEAAGREIKVVSMHRPSKKTRESDYRFDGIENSNSKKFVGEYKYLSDSRMHWRENVEDAICSGLYQNLHITLHPGWYCEEKNTMAENMRGFIESANEERYRYLSANIFDLESILNERE